MKSLELVMMMKIFNPVMRIMRITELEINTLLKKIKIDPINNNFSFIFENLYD